VPREHYDIVVFENKFPSLSPDAPEPEEKGTSLTPTAPGAGVCEVVLYSDDHDATLATMPEGRIRNLVEVWADRYEELGALPFVEYVFVFENKGEAIGVTLHHPHGQIYAYPFVPPRPKKELEAAGPTGGRRATASTATSWPASSTTAAASSPRGSTSSPSCPSTPTSRTRRTSTPAAAPPR
jgi:UDPglucose--hexose-1-phosphate uridylyltransferase